MRVHIICPPGRYGGVITGRIEGEFDPKSQAIAICQKVMGAWTTRQLDVPAARLWSWDLKQDRYLRVDTWMAVLVTKGFDPCEIPRREDYIFAHDQKAASPLTAAFSDEKRPDLLKGTSRSTSSDPVFFDLLFPYAWSESGRPGWKCLGTNPIETTPETSERWEVRVRDGVQYAVLQFSPNGARAGKRPPCTTPLGTLPADGAHVAFTSAIGTHILSDQSGQLTGLVTGLGCVFDHAGPLKPQTAADKTGLLRVVLWIHGRPRHQPPSHVLCEPSGYWVFDNFPRKRRTMLSYSIALATQDFTPGDLVPEVGGDVICVRKSLRMSHGDNVDGGRSLSES